MKLQPWRLTNGFTWRWCQSLMSPSPCLVDPSSVISLGLCQVDQHHMMHCHARDIPMLTGGRKGTFVEVAGKWDSL